MVKTETERKEAWVASRLKGGGKQVNLYLTAEDVTNMEALRIGRESNHALITRILKMARFGTGDANVDAVVNIDNVVSTDGPLTAFNQILDEVRALRSFVETNLTRKVESASIPEEVTGTFDVTEDPKTDGRGMPTDYIDDTVTTVDKDYVESTKFTDYIVTAGDTYNVVYTDATVSTDGPPEQVTDVAQDKASDVDAEPTEPQEPSEPIAQVAETEDLATNDAPQGAAEPDEQIQDETQEATPPIAGIDINDAQTIAEIRRRLATKEPRSQIKDELVDPLMVALEAKGVSQDDISDRLSNIGIKMAQPTVCRRLKEFKAKANEAISE
ncbi:MAG: hypothetical protein HQK59_04235 [Deltaproteobacteria bacterium]|nr:hypothetical protein [Deltaproteobacteria bacterium]MBF0525346.1 hypothetical protein [Deltaproteobacteria bacterium]